ncbi:MAG: molybdopterin cofactor-binding domain-containing protein [Pseudomonadota bacterium]
MIADVTLDVDGTPNVERLFCAHDCGKIINPDQVRAQCEGNLVWSIGMILSDHLTLSDGGIAQTSFAEAPVPSITDVPPMEIALIATDAPPTGAGETLMASAPAAIANTLIALTGRQPRRLPFTAEDFRI